MQVGHSSTVSVAEQCSASPLRESAAHVIGLAVQHPSAELAMRAGQPNIEHCILELRDTDSRAPSRKHAVDHAWQWHSSGIHAVMGAGGVYV